uniref:J domain-containing protein n=1 Tax=viral metagenome TaxID=1070528 RepID=A0A6C0JZX2_9ZZZZ
MEGKSYYDILEVPKTASESEIKKAYRTLSLKYHPDRNKTPDANAISSKINEAYETLSDPEKRRQYDLGGNGFPFKMGPGAGGPDDLGDLGNIFNMMFSGGFPGAAFHQSGMPGGPNIHVFHGPGIHRMQTHSSGMDHPFGNIFANMQKPPPIIKNIRITIDQAYLGCSIPVEIERWVLQNDVKHTETETIYIPIHRGIDENEFIILHEKGNIVNDNLKGDIKIAIQIENSSVFKRQGLDLIYTKTLTLKEALCGFTIDLMHLSGKKLTLSNTSNRSVISPTSKKVIGEFGMVRENMVGNLIIDFVIQFPEKINDEQAKLLEEIL